MKNVNVRTYRHVLITLIALVFYCTLSAQALGVKGKVRFQNAGQYDAKLLKVFDGDTKIHVGNIPMNSGLELDVTVGDRFEAQFVDEPSIKHRMIYVPELNQTYFIHGNVRMDRFEGFAVTFSTLSIDPNLFGIDTAHFNRRDLVKTMNKAQIFERLIPTVGTDYEIADDNILLKTGFTYSAKGQTDYSTKTRMSYGYSNFTSGWNIALSGNFPVKGVDVAGGFGYSEGQTTQSSSTDIYTFQRFQTLTHEVAVTPSKAYLDVMFVDRIRRLNTAVDAANLVNDYGTHYAAVVYYGGDLSAYLKMNSTDFMQATSKNIDLQAEVTKSSPSTSTRDGNKLTKEAGGSYGGKLAFSYKEGSEERRILERSESKVKVTGGDYNLNGDYIITRNNAAPLVTQLRRIDELITPRVIKDDLDPAHVAKAQALVKTAIDQHIAKYVPLKRPIHLPPPHIYEISLDAMQVTAHLDDANANTKGKVVAGAFSDASLTKIIPQSPGMLWEQNDFSLDFRFSPNIKKNFTNAKQMLLHYPDPTTGTFNPFFLNIWSTVREKDDIIWAPDGALMEGNSGPTDLNSLNLQPGGEAAKRSYDITSSGNGTIRVSYSIKKMENDFDSPGMLADLSIIEPDRQTSPTANTAPASDVEITMINSGGFAAKFRITYTVEGFAKSYESGDVLLGWRYTLPIPPSAKNVQIQAWSSWGGWKEAYSASDAVATKKCIELTGLAWDPKWKDGCN